MPKRITTSSSVAPISDEVLDKLLEGQDPATIFQKDGLIRHLVKGLVERALQGEMTHHLGYANGEPKADGVANSRNGLSVKTLQTEDGRVELKIPRDRDGSFEPQLIKKHQTRVAGLDERILALYARGMSTRDIESHLQELYGVDVSPELVSTVTDGVLDELKAWQNRPLDPVYPILYLDALVVKVNDGGMVKNKSAYLALGVNMEGHKEILGLWLMETEGAKFWLKVITEIRNRGVHDVLIVCTDGLKGFPEAIESVYAQAIVQTCIVHVLRASTRYVAWKARRALLADLKCVYTAATVEAAHEALNAFESKWGKQYPMVVQTWRSNWERITPFLAFPPEIRKAIYTTNAIEAINRQVRKVIKTKGHFPNDQAALKLMYLALKNAAKKWDRPIKQWTSALNQLVIHFPGRLPV